MSTIKLKKEGDSPVTPSTRKAPVRRNPALRDRSKAPEQYTQATAGEEKREKPKQEKPRQEKTREEKPRQDNRQPKRINEENTVARKQVTRERNREDRPQREARERNTREDGRARKSSAVAHANHPKPSERTKNIKDAFRDTVQPAPKIKTGAPEDDDHSSDNAELPRLSKIMADRGICSRREADVWIANGWVKVDGAVVDTLGTRIANDAKLEISEDAHARQAENVTILLHKPIGYVSGQAEDGYEPAVVLIHPENRWEDDPTSIRFVRGHLKGLAPAGRLDIDSTGLLVLTQDGRIARHLIGENSTVEKEYLVRVEGELSESGLKKLNHGLSLDGVALKPAKVSWQNEHQLRFVLREGKKRQIRRMCELVGLRVTGLKRIRIGSVVLGKLPLGSWRYLRADERF